MRANTSSKKKTGLMTTLAFKNRIPAVVPHLSIGPIGQLGHFFDAVRQYLPVDQLVRH